MSAGYRCGACGRSVSTGAQCVCLTPGFSESTHPVTHGAPVDWGRHIVAALERIATALETIAARDDATVPVKIDDQKLIDAFAKAKREGPFAL